MNIKKSTLTAAVSAIAGLGMAGQVAASVYGEAWTEIYDLNVNFFNENDVPIGPGSIKSFNFGITNTANLNGADDINTAACSGLAGPGGITNNCNPGTNTGLPTPNTRLDAELVKIGASTRTENVMPNWEGPGTAEYATADGVIWTAGLALDPATHTEQIAEAELQTGTSAGSSANIQSSTGFLFTFTIDDADNYMEVDFLANWDRYVSIDDPTASSYNAQANQNVTLRLSNDDDGNFMEWKPDGVLGTGCITSFGVCTENDDDGNLNDILSVSTDGAIDSAIGTADIFSMVFTGLYGGNWTFALQSETSTNLSRQVIPEPTTLALLGLGLAGIGAAGRRRKKLA